MNHIPYLKRWLAWAEAGATTDEFNPKEALCGNCPSEVKPSLDDAFYRDFFTTHAPFGGFSAYFAGKRNKDHHTDATRIAWVKQEIARYDTAT